MPFEGETMMHTVILACTTLLEAVKAAQAVCKTTFPVIELDRQYHVEPERMREHILQTLSALPDDVDIVLAAMGFCGGHGKIFPASRRWFCRGLLIVWR